ncbi:hypothetical protein SLS62_003961 [Diatrype stigma]|uniref:Cysteine dioxygenase n=1 Tax=Diatrype stigma TaxID=117547 RepID=A0AAN9YU75_9PEZI
MNDFTFDKLVTAIRDNLGPYSGLLSQDVEVDELTHLMDRYKSKPDEWSKYAIGNENMGYTRNLVDEGNDSYNLMILVWTPGKGSPIHDHGKAHCLMKILKGDLTETRYDFPDGDKAKPMVKKSEQVHKTDQTAYMSDDLGLHRVTNQGSDYAVSLHLYTPPNVAKHGCYVFDDSTGEAKHIAKCGYHSVFGEVLKKDEETPSCVSAAKAA